MSINAIRSRISHSGIVLYGWENVVGAVQLLLGSPNTGPVTIQDLDFVENVMNWARQKLNHHYMWSQVFSEDCPVGLFRMALGVQVQDRAKGIYVLSVTGQHSGSRPELELVARHGFSRAIESGVVEIEYLPTEDGQVQIDFDFILRRLQEVFPKLTMSGNELIQLLDEKSFRPTAHLPKLMLYQNEVGSIVLSLKNILPRYPDLKDPTHQAWQLHQNRLNAHIPPSIDWYAQEPPRVVIEIYPTQIDHDELSGPRMFYTPQLQAWLINRTSRVSRVFREYQPEKSDPSRRWSLSRR